MSATRLLTKDEFRYRSKEGDGICSLCNEWTLGKADPNSENVYCPECDNRSVYGVNVAKSLGLITVLG